MFVQERTQVTNSNIAQITNENHGFESSIPVIDMNLYHNPATRNQFAQQVENAREIGFFALVNTGISQEILEKGYAAAKKFFDMPQDQKDLMYKPELNGQRAYIPPYKSERADGSLEFDNKEYLHIGADNNEWPKQFDLETPMMKLYHELDRLSSPVLEAFAIALGKAEDFFVDMVKDGNTLMRPIHYLKNPDNKPWASAHTDIDICTFLPMATAKGLQIWYNHEWIDVKVPLGAIIVNFGDMLENISNGYFKSCKHRVVSENGDVERESIVHFLHPKYGTDLSPMPEAIAKTGGAVHYPQAAWQELLFLRLTTLALGDAEVAEGVHKGPLIGRMKAMVENNTASEAVNTWFNNYKMKFPEQAHATHAVNA